jgi:acyl-lipid omega-6 desaturase (Delta-12 desaturase)
VHKTAVPSSNGQPPDSGDDVLNARRWQRILANYSTPNRLRSIAELAITALPLILLWSAAWFTFSLGHAWASLLIAIPAAGFLVRLFMIQHDCGHGTFFAGRLANDCRDSGCRLSRAPVHDPARLRSWHLFCRPSGE